MAKTVEITKFKGIEVNIEMEKIIQKYGEKSAEYLKTNPSNPKINERRKGSKEYFKSWDYRYEEGTKTAIVYNKKNGPLTYLLERGHFIVNKKGGLGRAAPHPHIKPTFDKFKDDFVKDMEKAAIKVEIK